MKITINLKQQKIASHNKMIFKTNVSDVNKIQYQKIMLKIISAQ